MEYINIISKEEITTAFQLPITIAGCLAIAATLSVLVYLVIVQNPNKAIRYLFIVAPIGIGSMLITSIICAIFFQVPTGRYKYEATIDKDEITVSQYEEFIEKYNPAIKDGVYYWED